MSQLYIITMLARNLHRVFYLFAKSIDPLGTAITSASIKKGKKMDRQLTLLKRSLANKQPIPSQSLYDEYHHRDVYKRIDTELEAFFYKRQYNIENFNFLLNLLGHQNKAHLIPQVLQKMDLMKIQPDQRTHNYMIKAAAMQKDIVLTEKYFKQATEKFGQSKYFYTTLMQVYSGIDAQMSFKILQEMIEKGIEPDLPVYTTLINSFRVARKLQKCWEINRLMIKSKVELDETYVGVMLKVHAATHDAQKAIKLYQQVIIANNIEPMLQTKNSYFKVLSTRPEYSIRVIDNFFNMIELGQIVNEETIRWALKAASTTANVKSAIEIVKIMKLKQIQPTKQIYNSLIRVYAKACEIPNISQSYVQIMLMDTWKILEEVIKKDMVDTIILNNVMLVYANALQDDKIEGLILPLYQKFNQKLDPYSYQILVNLHYKKKDFKTAIRIWDQMKLNIQERKKQQIEKQGFYKAGMNSMREDLRPTFNSLELYIQIGIRLMDMHMILQALDMFKRLKRFPKNSTLKFLGNLKNLPEQILVALMDFKIRFGAAKLSKTKSNSQSSVKDAQDL